MSEQKRDLLTDLEICEKATPGPWHTNHGYVYKDGLRIFGDDGECVVARKLYAEDAEFISAAREGWPEAINRAIAAEDSNKELVEQIEHLECVLSEKEMQMADLHELVDEAEAENERLIEAVQKLPETSLPTVGQVEIEKLQAEVERLREKASITGDSYGEEHWCSECKEILPYESDVIEYFKYCPYCGREIEGNRDANS